MRLVSSVKCKWCSAVTNMALKGVQETPQSSNGLREQGAHFPWKLALISRSQLDPTPSGSSSCDWLLWWWQVGNVLRVIGEVLSIWVQSQKKDFLENVQRNMFFIVVQYNIYVWSNIWAYPYLGTIKNVHTHA